MRKQVKEAKRRRARGRRPARWRAFVPYALVGSLAVAAVAALFVVGAGGGSDGAEASYPPGYSPPTIGDASAPVEVVMWGDFQCPFCRRFDLVTLPELRREYFDTGKARFVWRNFVNYGVESEDAANAAYCAGEQGKFWEYHAKLYENQQGINQGAFLRANLERFAGEIGLDTDAFNACTRSPKYNPVLAADKKMGRGEGVSATPTFFVNGQLVVGAQPTETFKAMIENALARARS